MPQHYDDVFSKAPAFSQTFSNKLRADPLILVFRQDCHRPKPYRSESAFLRFDSHPAEEDVSNYLFIDNRDERNIRTSILPKRVNEISFIAPCKSEFVDSADRLVILECFGANENYHNEQSVSQRAV